ncbi:fimbrial protein [uncultured Parabacteroides sp.]|uniref:fimbrial protein n=1 Tax=uncultured Parabacteroides sp. TaxID=512312 RepID=UPI0026DD4742|nr:fimbrial protein [uncultured Parabacteroides sp.]
MNLRNILLAGLAVCTMASCSKDETVDYSQMGEVDAYVSFGVTAALQTKANVDETGAEIKEKENKVQKLTALIFKGTDDKATFVTSKTETATGDNTISEIKHIVVKVTPNAEGTSSNDDFVVVFLGNCEDLASTPATLGALREATLTKTAESYDIGSILPMVSQEIQIKGLRPNIKKEDGTTDYFENWVKNGGGVIATAASPTDPEIAPVGYASTDYVVLTRLISRVQVESVKLKLTEYPGASIALKKIALANVKPQSKFASSTGDYVKGYQSDAYKAEQYWIAPNSQENTAYASADYNNISANNGEEVTESFSQNKFVKYIFSNPRRTADNVNAVHTDGIYETGVILVVEFTNAAGTKSTKHMRVLLKDNGVNDVPEILMNHVYKLNITITGEGSDNEDDIKLNAHVAAKIDVAPWNVIEQNEEDAN